MSDFKNVALPGKGFLFQEDGLSLAEMAAKLHSDGYLTDAEMAEDGGVSALRRKLYDSLEQNRMHYSSKRRPFKDLSDAEKQEQCLQEKLFREVNEYANAVGVNDPKSVGMIIEPSDLSKFNIEVSGKNIVDAEIIASAIQRNPLCIEQNPAVPSALTVQLIVMVLWVLSGRPS